MARPAAASKPHFIPPMLATLVGGPFDNPDWLFEVKWDGFRVEAVVADGGVRIWTRGEKDAAQFYFGPFLDPPTWIEARQAVVDGDDAALRPADQRAGIRQRTEQNGEARLHVDRGIRLGVRARAHEVAGV